WRAAVMQQAGSVPSRLDVTAEPAFARPGDAVHVTVRVRETELPSGGDTLVLPPVSLRAVEKSTHRESAIRVWPAAEPGLAEATWRPAAPGEYVLDGSIPTPGTSVAGAALVRVAADARPVPADAEALALAARASGGGVVAGDEALVRTLDDRFPPRAVIRP